MAKLVPYTVDVAPEIGDVSVTEFASKVAAVLRDPRGWRKYGYEFYQVAEPRPGVLRIHLETAETAARECRLPGFSCQRDDPNDIIINHRNWMGGSKSSLPLDRYRNYVVNHETGHFLGLEHQACPIDECRRRGMKDCPAPVMCQMTRGPAHVAPCYETDWPLDASWRIDNPNLPSIAVEAFSARPGRAAFAALVVLVVLVILAAMVAAGLGRGRAAAGQKAAAGYTGLQATT